MQPPIQIAFVDDHIIVRSALADKLNMFEYFDVVLQASNGKELQTMLQNGPKINVLLLDVNMPEMDGYQTAQWLQKYYPHIHVIVFSMHDSEDMMIQMLLFGVKCFVSKSCEISDLRRAILCVHTHGLHYSDNVVRKILSMLHSKLSMRSLLSKKELLFLQLICSDDTYKQIACKMNITEPSVEKIRLKLCDRFNVKTRTSLAVKSLCAGLSRAVLL